MSKTIYVVNTYSDGVLVAYPTREEAEEARHTYHLVGLHLYEDTFVEEVVFIEND